MKLFRSEVTEKKKEGAKTRPILIVAETIPDARKQLEKYWGKKEYKWSRPNMIADFHPK